MKIYRFEHPKSKKGLFTSELNKEGYGNIHKEVIEILLDHYNYYPHDLPSPFDDCDHNQVELLRKYINDGYNFGCSSISQLAKWIMYDKEILENIIKVEFEVYEIELENDCETIVMKSQVIFNPQKVKNKLKLDIKNIFENVL